MKLPAEVLRKVKHLEVTTRKLVDSAFLGEYQTAFRGQGMTFADFREYVPGDDIRTMAWTLSARTGKSYVKTFEEEREMNLVLAVDVSGSTDFGSGRFFKGEAMAHVGAALAFAAQRTKDHVGLVLFSNQVEHVVPPKKGRGHILRLLRDLYYYRPHSHRTSIAQVCHSLRSMLKRRTTVFILSDFFDDQYEQAMKLLSRKHDVVAVVVRDLWEKEIPRVGILQVQDPETGEGFVIDTDHEETRRSIQSHFQTMSQKRDQALRKAGVDVVEIFSHEDIVDPLLKFFARRKRR